MLAIAVAPFAAGLLCRPVPAAAQTPGADRHIAVELVAESRTPAAGSRTSLAITMTPEPGWHGYWKNPGDVGLAPKIDWTLAAGATVSQPDFPVPATLIVGGLMNHVYKKPYALLVTLDVPGGLENGARLPISAKLDYLVCSAALCVPENAEVSGELTVGDGAADPVSAARFDQWRRELPRPLGSPVRFERNEGKFRLGVPLPRSVVLKEPHLFAATEGALSYAAPQTFSRNGDTLVIETAAGPAAPDSFEGVLALGGGAGLAFTAAPGPIPVGEAARAAEPPATLAVTLAALGGAILGGLILNVMPCVFPILSVKAVNLARAAGDEREARREALAYTAGSTLVCVALGVVILTLRAAGHEIGWAFQLQSPGVIFALILLTTAIGLNLAGMFELGTLSSGSDPASKGGATGAFWTGALAAFVATPCTGPFMAAALAAALVLPFATALLVFAGLGFGLASPFLALGYVPALRRSLPRPGAWMETFRRIMAVPMLVTALGLTWVLGRQTDADGVVLAASAAMLLALGLWLTGLRQRGQKGGAWWPAGAALALALSGVVLLPQPAGKRSGEGVGATSSQPFDAVELASLRNSGKPVFLYFTADWCLTCKVNEKAAIERAETQQAFNAAGVVTMVGDWTNGDPVIGRFITEQGRTGVPVYLWYAPGKPGRLLPQILTPSLLKSLAANDPVN